MSESCSEEGHAANAEVLLQRVHATSGADHSAVHSLDRRGHSCAKAPTWFNVKLACVDAAEWEA